MSGKDTRRCGEGGCGKPCTGYFCYEHGGGRDAIVVPTPEQTARVLNEEFDEDEFEDVVFGSESVSYTAQNPLAERLVDIYGELSKVALELEDVTNEAEFDVLLNRLRALKKLVRGLPLKPVRVKKLGF